MSELWEIEKLQKIPWLFLSCSHCLKGISFRFFSRQQSGSEKEDESVIFLCNSEPWKMLRCFSVPVALQFTSFQFTSFPVLTAIKPCLISTLCWKWKTTHKRLHLLKIHNFSTTKKYLFLPSSYDILISN